MRWRAKCHWRVHGTGNIWRTQSFITTLSTSLLDSLGCYELCPSCISMYCIYRNSTSFGGRHFIAFLSSRNKSFLCTSMFMQWQLLYLFQLTGATDSSFAEVWHAFTVRTFYCFKQHGIFNIHTGAANTWSNSTCIFIQSEHQQDCLGRWCVLFWNAGVSLMSDIPPISHPPPLSPSQFLQLSQSTALYSSFPPFRQTHWTTKQFLNLHAWGGYSIIHMQFTFSPGQTHNKDTRIEVWSTLAANNL